MWVKRDMNWERQLDMRINRDWIWIGKETGIYIRSDMEIDMEKDMDWDRDVMGFVCLTSVVILPK